MRREPRAHQVAVPGPGVFRIGRRVNADVTTAVMDVFKRGLLAVVEHIASGIQPHDDLVELASCGWATGMRVSSQQHFSDYEA